MFMHASHHQQLESQSLQGAHLTQVLVLWPCTAAKARVHIRPCEGYPRSALNHEGVHGVDSPIQASFSTLIKPTSFFG